MIISAGVMRTVKDMKSEISRMNKEHEVIGITT